MIDKGQHDSEVAKKPPTLSGIPQHANLRLTGKATLHQGPSLQQSQPGLTVLLRDAEQHALLLPSRGNLAFAAK